MPQNIHRALCHFLEHHPELNTKRLVIGYSGGRDSHVLLQACATLKNNLIVPDLKLKSIHVNHQIHPHAAQWAAHCIDISTSLDIPCQVLNITLNLQKGESLEARARDARYHAILEQLKPNDVLLTAHTQDDQAETLLLQLIRGAGVQGLSSMGESKQFGHTVHYRPLLSITREQIEVASGAYNLSWITDDSNSDQRFDRNFIRHQILPILKTRFKGVVPSLARTAQLCQEAANLQQAQAQDDFEKINHKINNQINGLDLIKLPFERQKGVIRYWIAKNNMSYPSKVKLEDMIRQINYARVDTNPCITWSDGILRRYKQNWYLLSSKEAFSKSIDFNIKKIQGKGFKLEAIEHIDALNIRYRQGGECCKPAGAAFSKSLKKWFQILEIPTWMRDDVPLVYYHDVLIGALGYFICEGWQVVDVEEWGIEVFLGRQ